MLREITIGQYYPVSSLIHRLDPRVKIIGTLVYIVSLFLFDSFAGLAVAVVFLGALLFLSKVPLRYTLKGLKPILVLLIMTVLFNFFLTPGEVIWKFGVFKITKEGLYRGAFFGCRLLLSSSRFSSSTRWSTKPPAPAWTAE